MKIFLRCLGFIKEMDYGCYKLLPIVMHKREGFQESVFILTNIWMILKTKK